MSKMEKLVNVTGYKQAGVQYEKSIYPVGEDRDNIRKLNKK